MNIVIIDDDPLVSEALRTILETDRDVRVLSLGKDGSEALPLYEKFLPDILLMDIRMKNMTGLEAGEEVLSRYPDARILFLTTFSDDDYVIKALRMGAKGYLLKQKFESIVPSLKAVMAEQSVFGEEVIARLPLFRETSQRTAPALEEYRLTPRELEILSLIADGLSNKEIAEKLFISEGTVRNAISLQLEKLRLRSRTQLAIFYLKNTTESR